jgi:hypothetical protein
MLKAGGEVDAFCTRCDLTLAHTIIAMMNGRPVKVECNTCHAVHRFRGATPSGGSAGTGSEGVTVRTKVKTRAAKPEVISFDQLLSSKDMSTSRPYSPKTVFALDQVIQHPIFGTGYVSAVRDGGKIEVVFRTDIKVLVHSKS